MRFNTRILHCEKKSESITGATNIPIYQSSSFEHKSAKELESIFHGREFGFVYTRIGNPTVEAFEKRINCLENGIGALACASGMSAVTLAIMNITRCGDEIVCGRGIFGGTYSLLKNLEDYGITTKFADDSAIGSFEKCITDKTRLIFIETIGNPKLDVPDIKKISGLAHSRNIPLIVDSTVTTPYLARPVELGADIVVHSTSKYINGSGNSIGGIIIDSGNFKWDYNKYLSLKEYERFGPFAYLARLRKGIFKDFGACISPFNAYLNMLGLETLALRMDKICSNAMKLALRLKQNPRVEKVNYPGLKDSEYYPIAFEQFDNRFGGILTIRTGSKEKAYSVINNLKYALNLANIGDVRTLVIHPASTIYAENTLEEKEKMGVYEDLIRISLGLEDAEDIIEDFEEALSV